MQQRWICLQKFRAAAPNSAMRTRPSAKDTCPGACNLVNDAHWPEIYERDGAMYASRMFKTMRLNFYGSLSIFASEGAIEIGELFGGKVFVMHKPGGPFTVPAWKVPVFSKKAVAKTAAKTAATPKGAPAGAERTGGTATPAQQDVTTIVEKPAVESAGSLHEESSRSCNTTIIIALAYW